jgi:ketosteroid isomerase-like protein
MSQENVDNVRRAAEAYERGDLSAVLETMSPELVTVVNQPIPVAGTYHGREGFLQLTLDWAEGFDELIATVEEFIDAGGDQVLTRILHKSHGAGSGVPVETDIWYLWTIRGGKGVRVDIFNDKSQALEAAGLSE